VSTDSAASAVGLGQAALVAADEAPDAGVVRLIQAMAMEMQMLVSALESTTSAT
jgi:isopentenyl diphosphate isomerase/L-lactate dehydrogenase-like FMN-dependent dehydrogenase